MKNKKKMMEQQVHTLFCTFVWFRFKKKQKKNM